MQGKVAVVLFCAFVAGCATQYQKQSFTGGFDETQLGPNVYRVSFKGNGYTSPERAADLALLRCADLSLQNGFGYFAIVDAREGTTHSAYTAPTQSYSTGSATASSYGGTTNVYGQARTTTYGGQTYIISKPSSTNTVVMLKDKAEFQGMTYDAKFLYESLGKKYEVKSK